jgi:hypothetical protein
MKDEALRMAMRKAFNLGSIYWQQVDSEFSSNWKKGDATKAQLDQLIEDTIKRAIAESALDKKAENARELGLDYEPALKDNSNYRYDPPVAEPVAWVFRRGLIQKFRWNRDKPVGQEAMLYWEPLYTTPPAAQPAVPDAIHHTDLSESLEYIQGWNDCRAEMLKEMKP